MKADNFSRPIKNTLRLMHWVIGKRVRWEIFDQQDWYWTYQWTPKQERIFTFLLIIYLRISRYARYEITGSIYRFNNRIQKAANEFAIWYGWRMVE